MLEEVTLPKGVGITRSSPEWTRAELPGGLLADHHLAVSVWGVLRVVHGTVVFVAEATGETRTIEPGGSQVIEPGMRHHIEPSEDVVLAIDFYR